MKGMRRMTGRTTGVTPMREDLVTLDRYCSLKAISGGAKVQDWVPGSGIAHPLTILSSRPLEPLTDQSAVARRKEE
jgi:hypothetical protein